MSYHFNPFAFAIKKYLFLRKVLYFGYCWKRPIRGVALIVSLGILWAFVNSSYVFMTSKYHSMSSLEHGTFIFNGLIYTGGSHPDWYIKFKEENGKERICHTYLTDKQKNSFPVTKGQKVTLYLKNEYMCFIPPFKFKLRTSAIAISYNGKFIINVHRTKKKIRHEHQINSKIFFVSLFVFLIISFYIYKVGKRNLKERGLYDSSI